MILEMDKGKIIVLQNSCERNEECLIYLQFKDSTITNFNTVKIFIEGQELTQVRPNVFRIDFILLRSVESKIEVIVEGPIMKVYSTSLMIQEYVSFGKMGTEKFPQALIDINDKLKKLEDRIKKLESEKTII